MAVDEETPQFQPVLQIISNCWIFMETRLDVCKSNHRNTCDASSALRSRSASAIPRTYLLANWTDQRICVWSSLVLGMVYDKKAWIKTYYTIYEILLYTIFSGIWNKHPCASCLDVTRATRVLTESRLKLMQIPTVASWEKSTINTSICRRVSPQFSFASLLYHTNTIHGM